MNTLSNAKRAEVIGMICEGMSARATSRLTGVSKNAIAKLVHDVGTAVSIYMDRAFVGLDSKRVECDEIWAFVGAKQRNVPAERAGDGDIGSIWTWTAIDVDSKLVITWMVGQRDREDGFDFIADLEHRLTNRIQLSSDNWSVYQSVVPVVFRDGVDFGTVTKTYKGGNEDHKYSPGSCTGIEKRRILGNPNMRKVNTSYVERNNLSIRMGSRRYTRLTNAFSKKIEHHVAATALHFGYFNLVRTHGTLNKRYGTPTTPAMAAGVEDQAWTVLDMIDLLEQIEAAAA